MRVRWLRTALRNLDEEATFIAADDSVAARLVVGAAVGASVVTGVAAPTMVAGVLKDSEGREFVGHWVVKPGREVRRKNVTETLQVPFDTTLHFVIEPGEAKWPQPPITGKAGTIASR